MEETINRSKAKAYIMPVVFCVSLISLLGFLFVRLRSEIIFEKHVTSYLFVAQRSIEPEMVNDNITYAINYMEANGLSHGYTSVFQKTEDENMDVWVQQLRDIRGFVINSNQKSTAVRAMQNILADGHGKIHTPKGAAIAGHNKVMWWWGVLSLLATLVSLIYGLACDWDLNPAPPSPWY